MKFPIFFSHSLVPVALSKVKVPDSESQVTLTLPLAPSSTEFGYAKMSRSLDAPRRRHLLRIC